MHNSRHDPFFATFIKKSLAVILCSTLCVSLCTANENIDQEKFKKWDFAIEQKKRCSISNQIGNNDCISREYKVSDTELNRLYKLLINDLIDPKPLKKAQLAWIKFRDLSCKHQLSGLGEDGSVSAYSKIACLINLTEKRILDLKTYSTWTYDGSPPRKR
ncbi:MAG: DUF1311 domain-containing protein [Methylobacter sp.]|nr:MAG: DUF1311 domain-containing protein [Methylobacter sp.]